MKFRINAEQLKEAVAPAADVASKNILTDKHNAIFCNAYMLTIEASPTILNIRAFGGLASITVKVRGTEGYVCEESGVITVEAKDLVDTLKSFSPTVNLLVCGDDYQLTISLESDPKVLVELLSIDITIKCPRLPKTFIQEATVNRATFLRGMKKVAWAMCEDKNKIMYMCMLFECWTNRMRFTAGTGSRFAIFDINHCQPITVGEDVRLLFPSYNIGNLSRIFGKASGSTIKIGTAAQNSGLGVRDQIVFENDSIVLALYGAENFTKYPDMDGMLHYDYAYQISTHIEDWVDVCRDIHASSSGHNCNFSRTRITADILHGYFEIQSSVKENVKKRVDFELGGVLADTSKDNAYQPWFCCRFSYIEEVTRKGYKDGIMTINFDDQAKLDDIHKDQPKQMMPVLVTHPTKTNKDGTKEKYSIFFTVSTK